MIRKLRNIALFILIAAGVGYFVLQRSVPSTPAKASVGHADGEHEEGAKAVSLSDAKVQAADIELVTAGPGTLRDTLLLNGIAQPNQEALAQVTPRFSGVVREIRKRIGDRVEKGELLARIESNQSLTVYEMRAPIAGTVIDRQSSLGEFASEQKPIFTIADLATVWVDVSVYRRDLHRVRLNDALMIDVEDGSPPIAAKISYISPVGSSDTQSALARATVSNADMRLRPGLFVTARLVLAARDVPIVVKNTSLQTVENRTVVFVRNGQTFEPRDVEVGARDAEHAEVLFGLLEGDVYAAKNSFVIKAELAKGSASHEH